MSLAFDDPRHGTLNGYRNCGCHCDLCRTANADYVRARRAARVALGLAPDDPRHGTCNAYTNYGCKCGPCQTAHRDYERDRLARWKAAR